MVFLFLGIRKETSCDALLNSSFSCWKVPVESSKPFLQIRNNLDYFSTTNSVRDVRFRSRRTGRNDSFVTTHNTLWNLDTAFSMNVNQYLHIFFNHKYSFVYTHLCSSLCNYFLAVGYTNNIQKYNG